MCNSIDALTKNLIFLNEKLRNYKAFSREAADRVTEYIISCASGLQRLRDEMVKKLVNQDSLHTYGELNGHSVSRRWQNSRRLFQT